VRALSTAAFSRAGSGKASIIFWVRTNYSPQISGHPFSIPSSSTIMTVCLLRKYGCHHLLLPDYPFNKKKDGVPFHRNFAKLGLGPVRRTYFVLEPLMLTIGNKSEDRQQYYEMLSSSISHLEYSLTANLGGGHVFCHERCLYDIGRIRQSSRLFAC
jgi:hypothetical protein